MLEDGRISSRQAVFLVINTILPTIIVFVPAMIYKEAARDGWISIILVTVFGMVTGYITASLGMRFPSKTIVQYSELIAGWFLGKAIGLLYAAFFLYINAVIIREFAELFTSVFMPETPPLVFSAGIVLVSAYGIRGGLEVLARVNEIVVPTMLIMVVLVVVMVSPVMHASNFIPVLEKGFLPVLKGAYVTALFFAETIVMAMFIPYLNRFQQAKRATFLGVLITGLFLLIAVVATIAVFGALTASIQFPFLFLARKIRIADLFERLDPFIMIIWVFGSFVKVGVFYYCTVLATAQWLNLREYKALVLPTGVLLTALSVLLWGNSQELTDQLTKVMPPIFLSIEVGLPLLLLVAACLRRKGEGGR